MTREGIVNLSAVTASLAMIGGGVAWYAPAAAFVVVGCLTFGLVVALHLKGGGRE